MRHGPICNAWPSVPRGRKNERQLQRMGRNLGTGRLRSNRGRTQKLFPRKFVQLESCRSLVLRLCIFFPFPPLPYFPFSLLPRFMARGEKIFERQFWGIFEKSKSRNFSKNRRKEGSPRNFLAFLDLFATSLRCGYYFRRKGRDGK